VLHQPDSAFLLGAFASLPLDSLFSTQGIMVMLLGSMQVPWMFLTSAPKVYTIMVSDLRLRDSCMKAARCQQLKCLAHYYNYEQTLGATAIDPLYMSTSPSLTSTRGLNTRWSVVSAKKNTQLHVISGSSLGKKTNNAMFALTTTA